MSEVRAFLLQHEVQFWLLFYIGIFVLILAALVVKLWQERSDE